MGETKFGLEALFGGVDEADIAQGHSLTLQLETSDDVLETNQTFYS